MERMRLPAGGGSRRLQPWVSVADHSWRRFGQLEQNSD